MLDGPKDFKDKNGAKNPINDGKEGQQVKATEYKGKQSRNKWKEFLRNTHIMIMAPIVKYYYYLISYGIFLFLLSLMALFGLTILVIDTLEIIVSFWIIGFLFEEALEVIRLLSNSLIPRPISA